MLFIKILIIPCNEFVSERMTSKEQSKKTLQPSLSHSTACTSNLVLPSYDPLHSAIQTHESTISQKLSIEIAFLKNIFNTIPPNEEVFDALLQRQANALHPVNVDACVTELVSHCIISVRTAWLIRRCSKPSDRFRKYLELLSTLKENDLKELMKSCRKSKAFIEKLLTTPAEEPLQVRKRKILIYVTECSNEKYFGLHALNRNYDKNSSRILAK